MESKRKGSAPKSSSKTQSKSNSKGKRSASPAPSDTKKKTNGEISSSLIAQLKKKPVDKLTKKKIEDLKPPEILIKVTYKGKRISIPISECDDRSLNETVMPHITRFEKEILKNSQFDSGAICNWKTSGHCDILKDYYFQTNKPIKIFKGQLLEIQPIWKEKKGGKVQLKDFEIIKCIGTGGFSRVFLTRLKATGVFYALKLMEKEGLFESGKECVVSNQRNIMVGLNSPYIVNLQFAFETKNFVALALQYCPGGELFYYMRKVKRMTEDQARYCFIEILLGIQYLHTQNIIYRDIKPQNIMIDAQGNLKIADFGLSREGLKPNELANTFCGSPEYMAPQMLAKSGHSYLVDYYCLGALLYELVTGNPPFYSRDVDKIYYSIQNQQIDFPTHIDLSQQIKMLIEGLLIKDPKKRLGSMGGIREILGHPWVRKIKPADIINKSIPTPVKIDLLAFNINQEEIQEGGEQFYQKFVDQGPDFQHLFEDFYFNRQAGLKVLDDALATSLKDHSKEDQSTKQQIKKGGGYKSSQSREKNQRLGLEIGHLAKHPTSEIHRGSSQNKLKKQKTRNNLNLIERAKKRDDKSIARSYFIDKEKSPLHLKKSTVNGLKRIKSSAALLTIMKKPKAH